MTRRATGPSATRRRRLGVVAALVGTFVLPVAAAGQNELVEVLPKETLRGGWGKAATAVFATNGNLAALGTQSGRVVLYSPSASAIKQVLTVPGAVRALAFSRDDKLLAIGSSDGTVTLANVTDNTSRVLGRKKPVTALAFHPSGALLAVATEDRSVAMWPVGGGEPIGRMDDGHKKSITGLAFVGRGETLVSMGLDRKVVYWDTKQQSILRSVQEPEEEVTSAASSPSGDLFILGTESARSAGGDLNPANRKYTDLLKVYRTETAAPQKSIDLEGRMAAAISLSADCRYLGVAMRGLRGSSIGVYDVARGVSAVDQPVNGRVMTFAFSRDGKYAVYGTEEGEWGVQTVTGVSPRPSCVGDLRGTKFAITGPREPLVKPTRRVRFAVMDLDDNGVGADVSRAITDQLSNRLALNPAVRLVERRRIGTILAEQNLQKSGRTEATSAVQLARIFNVQKMLLGSVSKLGTTMVITVQLVDVETANLDGSREIQCRSCEVEELSDAMAELSHALVAEPSGDMTAWPAPPSIEVDYPRDNAEVTGNTLTFRAHVGYTKPLDGVELLVNGKPVDASRLLDGARDGKLTKMSVGLQNVALVQELPLDQATNVIAIRALGGDGNDEQRIVMVKRSTPAAAQGAAPSPGAARGASPVSAGPAITYAEIEVALGSRVPSARLSVLVKKYGVDFALDGVIEAKLRALGATSELVTVIRAGRR